MEHQIVASGREGGNRRKGDPCPVIRDLWKRERQGRLRGGLMLVAMDFILSLGETGGAPTPGGFSQRVRKRLERKELSFWQVQKSAQAPETKEDRPETRVKVRRSEGAKVEKSRSIPEWEESPHTRQFS